MEEATSPVVIKAAEKVALVVDVVVMDGARVFGRALRTEGVHPAAIV